jgi:hypothetical protein
MLLVLLLQGHVMRLRSVSRILHTDLLSSSHIQAFMNHLSLSRFVLLLRHPLALNVLSLPVRHSLVTSSMVVRAGQCSTISRSALVRVLLLHLLLGGYLLIRGRR